MQSMQYFKFKNLKLGDLLNFEIAKGCINLLARKYLPTIISILIMSRKFHFIRHAIPVKMISFYPVFILLGLNDQ